MQAIEVKNLSKEFKQDLFVPSKKVLKNIQFSVEDKVTTGFVGNNGSGKTTTLKSILDFIKPQSGEVLFWEEPLSVEIKKKIGYLPERPYLYEFMTLEEFLKFHWDLGNTSSTTNDFEQKCAEVILKVGLKEARKKVLREFSKGMLQRAGIAQAILHDPQLLIFDEPMSGLDPDGRAMVKEIIKNEQAKGVTIFFSSHLLQDMEELCKNLIVIDHGKIVYQGSMQEFKSQYKTLEEAFRQFSAHTKVESI